jgi:hypothetical protein
MKASGLDDLCFVLILDRKILSHVSAPLLLPLFCCRLSEPGVPRWFAGPARHSE